MGEKTRGLTKKKLCSHTETTTLNCLEKCAADPEKFLLYIMICVDLPCGQTYIWFVFLAMAIDHPTGLNIMRR